MGHHSSYKLLRHYQIDPHLRESIETHLPVAQCATFYTCFDYGIELQSGSRLKFVDKLLDTVDAIELPADIPQWRDFLVDVFLQRDLAVSCFMRQNPDAVRSVLNHLDQTPNRWLLMLFCVSDMPTSLAALIETVADTPSIRRFLMLVQRCQWTCIGRSPRR